MNLFLTINPRKFRESRRAYSCDTLNGWARATVNKLSDVVRENGKVAMSVDWLDKSPSLGAPLCHS